jgi:murein DD-endopeptidase MepM/ murein hydrolase activator NlpD
VQLPIDPSVARIVSGYGWRTLKGRDDYHTGLDFGAPEGTPIRAAADGTIVKVYEPGDLNAYGRTIVIHHSDDPSLLTLYAHLQTAIDAQPGTAITAGQQIGTVGRTAGTRSDPGRMFAEGGAHLHFEALARWPAKPDQYRYDPIAALGLVVPTASRPAARPATGAGAGLLLAFGLWWYFKDQRRSAHKPIAV